MSHGDIRKFRCTELFPMPNNVDTNPLEWFHPDAKDCSEPGTMWCPHCDRHFTPKKERRLLVV